MYTITKLSIQTHTGQKTYKCIQSLSYLCNSHRTENIQVYTINKLVYASSKKTENIQVYTITMLPM